MGRTADAEWKGSISEGGGTLALGSGAFEGNYTFKSRFEDGEGTNPEELMAASHAGCFSMALSLILGEAGHDPESIKTTADVTLKIVDGNPSITKIVLSTTGKVPGIDAEEFAKHAETAKENCPISKALASVPEITLETSFES
ncbi:OsmC family protein [soil metagenome]